MHHLFPPFVLIVIFHCPVIICTSSEISVHEPEEAENWGATPESEKIQSFELHQSLRKFKVLNWGPTSELMFLHYTVFDWRSHTRCTVTIAKVV